MKIVTLVDELTESNCYLIEEEREVLIIDPNQYDKIYDYLCEYHWTPQMIILTHEHCDHIGGLESIRSTYQIPVIASKACSEGIQSTKNNMSSMMEVYLYFKGKQGVTYPSYQCRPADIIYEEQYEWTWKEHKILCKSIPGHTLGSSCIWLDQKSLFTGDYLLPQQQVITRLPGGSQEAYVKYGRPSLQKLQPGTHIYPGHGMDYSLTKEGMNDYGL
ncbi:MAG: MBL fold metallo-hydrolase [Lachnospiraceae bacterium]